MNNCPSCSLHFLPFLLNSFSNLKLPTYSRILSSLQLNVPSKSLAWLIADSAFWTLGYLSLCPCQCTLFAWNSTSVHCVIFSNKSSRITCLHLIYFWFWSSLFYYKVLIHIIPHVSQGNGVKCSWLNFTNAEVLFEGWRYGEYKEDSDNGHVHTWILIALTKYIQKISVAYLGE